MIVANWWRVFTSMAPSKRRHTRPPEPIFVVTCQRTRAAPCSSSITAKGESYRLVRKARQQTPFSRNKCGISKNWFYQFFDIPHLFLFVLLQSNPQKKDPLDCLSMRV